MIYNLTNISFTLNTMIALELSWLTLVMSSDPIDIIDVTHCCAIFLFCWANNYYWCDTWWSENEMIILWKKKQASFAFPVSLHWWSTKQVSPTPIINWLKLQKSLLHFYDILFHCFHFLLLALFLGVAVLKEMKNNFLSAKAGFVWTKLSRLVPLGFRGLSREAAQGSISVISQLHFRCQSLVFRLPRFLIFL